MTIVEFDGEILRGNGACARLAKKSVEKVHRPLKYDEAGLANRFDMRYLEPETGAPSHLVEAAFSFPEVDYFFCLASGNWSEPAAKFECFLSVVRRAKAMFDLDPELYVTITFGSMGIGSNSIFGPAVEKTCWIEECYVRNPGIVLSRSLSSFVSNDRSKFGLGQVEEFDRLFPNPVVNQLSSMRLV